jgi:hypothetical protein
VSTVDILYHQSQSVRVVSVQYAQCALTPVPFLSDAEHVCVMMR